MNQAFPLPLLWSDRVTAAKRNERIAERLLNSIIAECGQTDADWKMEAQYAIDTGIFDTLEALIEAEDNWRNGRDAEGYPLDATPDRAWSDADKVRMFGGLR